MAHVCVPVRVFHWFFSFVECGWDGLWHGHSEQSALLGSSKSAGSLPACWYERRIGQCLQCRDNREPTTACTLGGRVCTASHMHKVACTISHALGHMHSQPCPRSHAQSATPKVTCTISHTYLSHAPWATPTVPATICYARCHVHHWCVGIWGDGQRYLHGGSYRAWRDGRCWSNGRGHQTAPGSICSANNPCLRSNQTRSRRCEEPVCARCQGGIEQ